MDIVIRARKVKAGVYEYRLGFAVFEIKRIKAGRWELAEYVPFYPGRVRLDVFTSKTAAHEAMTKIVEEMFINA